MTLLKILMPLPAGVSAAALADLLTAAGLKALSRLEWFADCPGGDGVPVVLLVVSNEEGAVAALEGPVRAAATRGDRVIAVWPPGSVSSPLPHILQDYGAALIVWDPVALHSAICGEEPEWQDAGGGTREAPAMKRNKNC